jgi:starvation-inducible DNA-binding protein
MTTHQKPEYTVPTITKGDGARVAEILQQRLDSLNDLALTLKHAHWNVVGPHFIAVHEMIDPQVKDVRSMTDEIAERIATLGVAPQGTIGGIVERRTWDDYGVGRADALTHLAALDIVYRGVIANHRAAADETEKLDPVTNDMLIGHLHSLELFHWFVQAHLENAAGALSTGGTSSHTPTTRRARKTAASST